MKDNSVIQLTELKLNKDGYLYCMILKQNENIKKQIMSLHVKYGIYIFNTPAVWKRKYLVNDPNWIIYFNIDDLQLDQGLNQTNYTFYYYGTDKRVEELAGVTEVKTIDFKIWKTVVQKLGLRMKTLAILLAIISLTLLSA